MEIASLANTCMEVEQPINSELTTAEAIEDVTVESIILSELLSRPLAIPEYKRPYVWGKR